MRSFMYTIKAPFFMQNRHTGLLARKTSEYRDDSMLVR